MENTIHRLQRQQPALRTRSSLRPERPGYCGDRVSVTEDHLSLRRCGNRPAAKHQGGRSRRCAPSLLLGFLPVAHGQSRRAGPTASGSGASDCHVPAAARVDGRPADLTTRAVHVCHAHQTSYSCNTRNPTRTIERNLLPQHQSFSLENNMPRQRTGHAPPPRPTVAEVKGRHRRDGSGGAVARRAACRTPWRDRGRRLRAALIRVSRRLGDRVYACSGPSLSARSMNDLNASDPTHAPCSPTSVSGAISRASRGADGSLL